MRQRPTWCRATTARRHRRRWSLGRLDALEARQLLSGTAFDFSGGFTGGGLALNGSAAYAGTALQLTDGGTNEAGGAFSNAAVPVGSFTSDFAFQITNPQADGLTFTIQGDGPTALGGAGGMLGYGGLAKSLAIKFDLFDNAGEGANSTGLYTAGAAPTTPATDLTPSGINLHGGDVIQAHLSYDGSTLTVQETDATTAAKATQSYPGLNIPALVGGPGAWVGFTAGTGGMTATQQVLSWSYSATATAGNSYPYTASGTAATATPTGGASFASGHDGTAGAALAFDGTGEADAPDSPALDPTDQVSVSAWVNATDWDGNRRIVQKGDIGTDDQYRLTAEGGALKFDVAGVGSLTGPLPAVKSWHHVAGTYDGTALCLYEDGVLVASVVASGPIAATSGPLVIGDKPGSTVASDHFLGAIDGVEVDNVALQPNDFADRTGHAPTAVTAVTAVATSGTGVLLSWGIDGTADGYLVEESTDGTTFTTVTTLANPDVSGLLVTGLSPATGYTFRVTATNAAGPAATRITPPARTGPADTSGLYQVGGPDAGPDGILPIHHDEAADTSASAVSVLHSYVEAGSETEAVFQALGGSVTNTRTGRSYTLGDGNTPAPGRPDRPWQRPITYAYRVRTPGAPAPAGDVGAFHFTADYVTTNPGDAGPAGTHVGQALAVEDLWNVDPRGYDWNDDFLRVSVQRVAGPGTSPDGTLVAHHQFSQLDSHQPVPVTPAMQASGVPILPDSLDGTSINPNYLVAVTVYGTPNRTEYLDRSNSNIDVWSDQSGASAILTHGSAANEGSIAFDSTGTATVWVGWDGSTNSGVDATLTILAQPANPSPGGPVLAAQAATPPRGQGPLGQIVWTQAHSLVVGIAGHSQSDRVQSDAPLQSSGTHIIGNQLRNAGYVVRLYSEDPGNKSDNPIVLSTLCGFGAKNAYTDIKDAYAYHKLIHVAAYGYSHGGGSVYDLSVLLDKEKTLEQNDAEHFQALSNYTGPSWTGYIDAIYTGGFIHQIRLPIRTGAHFNRWQSIDDPALDFLVLHGAATAVPANAPAQLNQQQDMDDKANNINHLDHTNLRKPTPRGISEDLGVQIALRRSLAQAMQP